MSKKHRKWADEQHRTDHSEPPHGEGEDAVVYSVRIQPNPDDENRYADERGYRKNQIESAKKLNVISGIGVGVAFLTFIALVIYACITHQQLIAMLGSNKLTQQSLNVSQRAYVTIGRKDGVVASFIPSRDPKQNAVLVMYFQNSGHIPAKVAWGTSGIAFIAGAPGGSKSSGIKYYGPPFQGLPPRMRFKKTGGISENQVPGQQSALIAGESTLIAPIGEISEQDLAALPAKKVSTLVMGGYQYCDELGTNIRREFALSYQNAPNSDLSFKLTFDSDSLAIPLPAATADVEYLPPCETITKRDQNRYKAAAPN